MEYLYSDAGEELTSPIEGLEIQNRGTGSRVHVLSHLLVLWFSAEHAFLEMTDLVKHRHETSDRKQR